MRQAYLCPDGEACEVGTIELLPEFSAADDPDAEPRQ